MLKGNEGDEGLFRPDEGLALHPLSLYSSALQKKDEGDEPPDDNV